MPNNDAEQVRNTHFSFGITIEAFNAMNIFDKGYFFWWKGEYISNNYEGKSFQQIRKLGNFYIELKTANGKNSEYKSSEKLEQLQAPKVSIKKASPTDEELDKRIIAKFQKHQKAYTDRWANRSPINCHDDDLPF